MFSKLFNKPPKPDDWYRTETWGKEDQELFELKLSKSRGNFQKAQHMGIKAYYMSDSKDPEIRKAARELFIRLTNEYPEEAFSVEEAYFQLAESYQADGDIKNAEKYYRECIAYKKNLKKKSGIYVPVEQSLANLLAYSNNPEKRKEAKVIEDDLYTNKSLTDEEMRIVKILSRGNKYQLQSLVERPIDQIRTIIADYYQRKPIVEALNAGGIKINLLGDFLYPEYKNAVADKTVTILVDWLKKDSLAYDVKISIIGVLIEFPIAKKYAFDMIIEFYKSADPNYTNERGYKTGIPIELGNAMLRWVDDVHAETVFDLLESKKFNDDGWLIRSLANLKRPDNVKKAIKILLQKLKKPNLPNSKLWTFIYVLRKLKAVETRKIVYPFTNFPENYVRTIEIDPQKYGYTSNGEVRAEAKKAIIKFDTILAKTNTE